MRISILTWSPWAVGLLLLSGCCYPVRSKADGLVAEMAAHPLDASTPAGVDPLPPLPPANEKEAKSRPDASFRGVPPAGSIDASVRQAVAQEPDLEKPRPLSTRPLSERLPIPPELPGANAPPLRLPRDPKEREAALDRLFPVLAPVGPDVEPGPGPDGQPVTLSQLQHLAVTNSPLVRQAAADVEAARGTVIQAGAYPNPMFGYEGDQIGAVGTAGQQGFFLDQLIKTGGKLQLAQASAMMDERNAEVALRKAQNDLATQVRAGYFAVLVARENVKITRALVRFTDEVYRIEVEQVKGAQAAAYEPMQMRVLAIQARAALVQARNRYVSAWKQLAATLGLPALPPTLLEGRVDMPIPVFQYDIALAQVLTRHTDVLTAQNVLLKARYDLRSAQVAPIPDVDLRFTVQKDFTGNPSLMQSNVTVGVPVPVWNTNKGNIIQAQGGLLRATEESHRVRDDLTSRLAEAFERYENNRLLLEYYRTRILPDQVRAYRGAFERHQQEPDKVGFGDVVNAQQILAASVTTYVVTLGAMWTAVTDVGGLLQTKDLFHVGPGAGETECPAPVPDLENLPALPCCHPLSPVQEPWMRAGDGIWPAAMRSGE